MAFLVCYSRTPPTDDWKDKAIYLDFEFYQLIFAKCRSDETRFPTLGKIALLEYDGDDQTVTNDELAGLSSELSRLDETVFNYYLHAQIAGFQAACKTAIEVGCNLKIGGDMYPQLRDGFEITNGR